MGARHEGRVHPHRDRLGAVVDQALAHGQQLDDEAGLARLFDHRCGDAGDALAVNGVQRHRRVEGEAGEDSRLLRGVVALDIGRGVGLGVAETLRIGQHIGEVGTLGVHAVEDVVRGAVDDPHDPHHAVAGERIAQRPDDRDRTGGCRLVVHRRADPIRRLEDLGAVRGQQGFVGRHDIGAGAQGEQDVRARGLDATHQLDDDVGAGDEAFGIRGVQLAGQVDLTRRVHIAHRDTCQFERRPRTVGELIAVSEQEGGHLGSHGSGAQQRHAKSSVIGHLAPSGWWPTSRPVSRANRSRRVSPRTITREVPSSTATTGGRGTWL